MNTLFVKKTSMPKPVENLNILSATLRGAPELLKALSILSDMANRRFAIDWGDLKAYLKSEEGLISRGDLQGCY